MCSGVGMVEAGSGVNLELAPISYHFERQRIWREKTNAMG